MGKTLEPVTVFGPDLTLRPWRRGDEQGLVAAFADPAISRFTLTIPQPYTLQHAEGWVDELAPSGWRSGGAEFAIDLGDGWAVGGIAIRRVERSPGVVGSIGYWVAASARGQGLAGRALRVLAPWAAEQLGLQHQELFHDLDNIASCRSALAAGFEVSNVRRGGSRYRDGSPRDVEFHEWFGDG